MSVFVSVCYFGFCTQDICWNVALKCEARAFLCKSPFTSKKMVVNGEEDEEGKGGEKRERQAGRGVVYFIPLLKKGEDERREEFLLLCFVNQNVTLRRRGRPSICRKSLSLPFHPSIPSLPFPTLLASAQCTLNAGK